MANDFSEIGELIKIAGLNERFVDLLKSCETKEDLRIAITAIIEATHDCIEDEIALENGENETEIQRREDVLLSSLLNDKPDKNILPEDVESFYDLVKDYSQYEGDDYEIGRGRACDPIFLDDFPDFLIFPKKILGIDVARQGDAKTVVTINHGGHVTDIQSFTKQDYNSTALKILPIIHEEKPHEVIIDGTGGWGLGVYDALVTLGAESLTLLTTIAFNEVPRSDSLGSLNKRAEMYLILQERLRSGQLTLPPHIELLEELTWIRYEFVNSSGTEKIKIVDKSKIAKQRGRSPDFADSLALSCYDSVGVEMF